MQPAITGKRATSALMASSQTGIAPNARTAPWQATGSMASASSVGADGTPTVHQWCSSAPGHGLLAAATSTGTRAHVTAFQPVFGGHKHATRSLRIGCSILADNSVIRHVSGQQRVHPVHAASPLAAEHQSRAAL